MLTTRAEQLARDGRENEDEDTLEVVVFSLGQEQYAVGTAFVRKVLALEDLTPLPGVPDFVRGITNVRGQIIAVMDLGIILSMASRTPADLTRLVVLSDGHHEFGLLAENVGGVHRLPTASIKPPISTLTEQSATYIFGETAGHLVVLDAVRLLHDKRLTVQDHITTQS